MRRSILQMGSPVWLKRKACRHITLVRQKPLGGRREVASARAGLGFTFKDQQAADGAGVEARVTEVKSGGALWLHGKIADSPVRVGDVITHVDGKQRTTGDTEMFKGAPFSRVCLAGRRGEGGEAFECEIVRMELLPKLELDKIDEYKKAVQCHPPIPPASRINANSENQLMAAPLIHGLDIKAAARVGVRACMR